MAELDSSCAFLKGVGPKRAELLRAELGIDTVEDLISHLPFRYEDRSKFVDVSGIASDEVSVQIQGHITRLEQIQGKKGTRLRATFFDQNGEGLELVWFKGVRWMASQVPVQRQIVIFGKPQRFGPKWSIAHPCQILGR